MDDVEGRVHRAVAADGAGQGLLDLGGAAEGAQPRDRVLSLDDHRDGRPRAHQGYESLVEALPLVLGVVRFRQLPRYRHHLEGDYLEALALYPRYDLAGQATLQDARLKHGKRHFDGHGFLRRAIVA